MVTEQAKIINDLRMFPKHLENRINRIFKYLAMQDLADYKQRMSLNLQAHESFNEFSLFRTQNKKLQMSLSQLEFFPS